MEQKETSFTAACKDFFGLRPEQSLRGFMDEVKRLTDADKAEIKQGLEKQGYLIKE